MSDFDQSDRPAPFLPPRIPPPFKRLDLSRPFTAEPPINEELSSPSTGSVHVSALDDLTKTAPGSAIPVEFDQSKSNWPEPDFAAVFGNDDKGQDPLLDLALLRHDRIASWVEQIAEAHRVTSAMALLGLLVTAAAALGTQVTAALSPTWHVRPILWGLLIGEPGLRKSPLIEFFTRLLHPIQLEEVKRWEMGVAAATARNDEIDEARRVFRREQRAAERQQGPAPQRPSDGTNAVVVPLRPGLILQDPSIEAAMELAAGSPRGLVAMPDEAAMMLAGNNGASNRSRWLQAAGGRPITVERISRPSRDIPCFAISVFTGTQPDLLKTLIGPRDDGFLARFLCLWPRTLPKAGIWRGTVDVDGLAGVIASLRRAGNCAIETAIPLSDDALDYLDQNMARWERLAADAGGIVAGFCQKADAHAVRIALVLAALKCADKNGPELPTHIAWRDLEIAITLVDQVFLPGVERVGLHLKRSVGESMSVTLLNHLKSTGASLFNARELRRTRFLKFGSRPALQEAIDELCHAGLVRRLERPAGTTGRSRGDYEVNPALHR